MGEEQKEEEKKEEPPKEEEPPAPPEIVLKVDMHCAGCARKVQKSLRRFEGVEEVKADNIAKTVVVKGAAADPAKICERVQKKTGRRVELLSPLPPPPPPEEEKKEDPPKEEPAPPEENKEEPKPITVVLKIRMHCESCAHAITKRIKKMEGVESVETDIANDQIMVKGVFDPNVLVENVYRRTRRQPLIIPDEEKKEEKKEEEKKDEHHEELKKIEYWPPLHHIEYAYPAYPAYPAYDTYNVYQTPHVQYGSYIPPQHAHYGLYAQPQAFSDENPNACSVM